MGHLWVSVPASSSEHFLAQPGGLVGLAPLLYLCLRSLSDQFRDAPVTWFGRGSSQEGGTFPHEAC